MDRPSRLTLLPAVLAAIALAVGACSPGGDGKAADRLRIRIACQPIEAALPIWVAEEEGLFEAEGLTAEVRHYDSATDRNVAMQTGAVDAMMASPVALGLLEQGGVGVRAVTTLHGSTPEQGRDGIAVTPGSSVESLGDLAGKPIGMASSTRLDYIIDSLLSEAGVPTSSVVKEEVRMTPVRYDLMMRGKLEAAALPEPWLTLAEIRGARVIADSADRNLVELLLIVSEEWLATPDGADATGRAIAALDRAARMINDHPELYRGLLVEKTGVPDELGTRYPVSHYPRAALPSAASAEAIFEWMVDEGLLDEPIPYDEMVWEPAPDYAPAAGPPDRPPAASRSAARSPRRCAPRAVARRRAPAAPRGTRVRSACSSTRESAMTTHPVSVLLRMSRPAACLSSRTASGR